MQNHEAVPVEDVVWLHNFMRNNGQPIPFHSACCMLRRRFFPFVYDPHPWVNGREETNTEVLRSIMAIYIFQLEVRKLKNLTHDPANFSKYLYQPEMGEGIY